MGRITVLTLAGLVSVVGLARADKIEGKACYHYSDNESLIAAQNIAMSLAKRDALESYQVYVGSTSLVENSQLKNDVIESLSAAILRNLTVVSKSEDPSRREVCRHIRADIDPVEAKRSIQATISAQQSNPQSERGGLPVGEVIAVIRADQVVEINETKVRAVILCKSGYVETHNFASLYIRMTSLDSAGVPLSQEKQQVFCQNKGDIQVASFKSIPGASSVTLDLVETEGVPLHSSQAISPPQVPQSQVVQESTRHPKLSPTEARMKCLEEVDTPTLTAVFWLGVISFSVPAFFTTTWEDNQLRKCQSKYSLNRHDVEELLFVHFGKQRLEVEVARGQGEFLDSFLYLQGCSLPFREVLSADLRQQYPNVFDGTGLNTVEILYGLKSALRQSKVAQTVCAASLG